MKIIDKMELLLDLGLQPISNRFLTHSSNKSVPHYPMKLMLEKDTGGIRLQSPFPVEEVKPRYDWLTCFEPEDHLDDMVKKIIDLPNINKNVIFAGYSFKDDSTLDRLKAKGYRNQWRIDPQRDLGITDTCANVETFQSMFNVARDLTGWYANIIAAKNEKKLLISNSLFIISFPE